MTVVTDLPLRVFLTFGMGDGGLHFQAQEAPLSFEILVSKTACEAKASGFSDFPWVMGPLAWVEYHVGKGIPRE